MSCESAAAGKSLILASKRHREHLAMGSPDRELRHPKCQDLD